jgi:hypothetical protein
MALKLDNNLLEELGLGALPDHEKQLLLRQIYEKLEMNVGVRLADQMSNEQLDEFEKFVDANDDKGAFQWLEGNFPNYKDVVNEEFEKLKAEIKQYAPQMLAMAAQNAQAPQAGPAGPAGPAPMQGGMPLPQQSAPAQPIQPMQPPVPPAPQFAAPQPMAQPMQQPQGFQTPGPQPGMGYPPQQPGAMPQFGPPAGYPQAPPQPGMQPGPGPYPGYPAQQPPAGPGQQ